MISLHQNLPGSASLIQDIDKKMVVTLWDGHVFYGILRSVDQYANLILHHTYERIHVGNKYCDVYKGIFLIRGENVILIGEMNLDFDVDENFQKVSETEIFDLQRTQQEIREAQMERKKKILEEKGLSSNLHELWLDDN